MRICSRLWLAGFALLLSTCAMLGNTAILPEPREGRRWREAHLAHAARARQGGIDVLFLGDSITERWSHPKVGLPVWEREFMPGRAANFGIDGDRTQHLLWRLRNGEGEGISPKVIVLLIGTNNTGLEHDGVTVRNTPEETVQGVALVLQDLRKRWPDATILLLALLPRGHAGDIQRRQIAEINQAIVALADGAVVKYLDFVEGFVAENGQIRTELMPDRLHPSTKGYEVLAEKLTAPLREALRK